jgi:hypothetical protein
MSFLNPLLWIFAAGLAVPVWLHLRHKPGSHAVRFSALHFLEDEPRPKRDPLRVRDPLLLLVRALALLLAVAALAWPYLRGGGRAPVVESRVHVLDDTLSRQADSGLEEDKAAIVRALRDAPTGVQDGVVVLSAQARVLGGLADPRADVAARVQALTPSFERGSYLEALRVAAALLEQSLGEKKTILVYGDGQANQWSENEGTAPFLRGIDVVLAGKPARAERPNLFVAEPSVQRSFEGDKALVDVLVRFGHRGPAPLATLVLEANGVEVVRKTVDITREPETVTLRARWESDPKRFVMGEVRVSGSPDDLPADDKSVFSLPPAREGRVALLARSPYLRTALSPEVMRGRWDVRPVDPTAPGLAASGELLDSLLVEASYVQSQPVRDLLLRYLNNGRGVILLVDRGTPLVKGFLHELGFELVGEARDGDGGAAFKYVAGEHPVFKPFLLPDFGSLLDVRVHGHVRLLASGALPLLFSGNGDGLVFEGIRTKGRLLVFAFGFDRAQTNWAVDPTFVPFLDLCLQHVRAASPIETSIEPGTLQAFELPPDRNAGSLALRSGDTEVARVAVGPDRRVQFRAPAVPGLYSAFYDSDTTVAHVFSVNPSAKESDLRYTSSPSALQAWIVPGAPAGSASKPAPAGAPLEWRAAAIEQRLWWWALLCGLALLALEAALLERRVKA